MPAIVRSEFALALNQVATERGIDPSVVLETIKAAILAAYRKDYGAEELELLTVDLNPDTGESKVLKEGRDVTPPGFGRIAAQTAKQVILQKIREAEIQRVPYILVIGEKEAKENKVAVRERGKGDLGAMALEDFIKKCVPKS